MGKISVRRSANSRYSYLPGKRQYQILDCNGFDMIGEYVTIGEARNYLKRNGRSA